MTKAKALKIRLHLPALTQFALNKKLVLMAVVALVVGAGGAFFAYHEYNRTNADINDLKVDATVTADELFNAFEADALVAGEKYLGKVIEVSGKVQSVSDVVLLEAQAAMDGGVQASLKAGEKAEKAVVGAEIKLKCQCSGRDDLFGSVVMKDCVIL